MATTRRMGEEEQFGKAVKYVNGPMKDSNIKLSNEQKLQLYQNLSFYLNLNTPVPGYL